MKIALIHLIGFSSDDDPSDIPLNLAGIASYIRTYGGFEDIKIIGKNINIIKSIQDYKPDIVGISVVSHQYNLSNKLAGEIKSIANVPLIIGGPHITALPEQLKNSNFDIGVIGEGEETFLELLKCYKKNKDISSGHLKKIKGLVLKDSSGKVFITEKRELIKNLDDLPPPALDILNVGKDYAVPGPQGNDLIGIRSNLMTSRGCPYNCIFCGSNTVWGRKVRWQSAERVVGDIKMWVNKCGVNYFFVQDDIMMANLDRLKKIVYLLEKEGLTKKIKFDMYARANLITDETCRLLKRLNVSRLFFGLESGSDKILNYLKKGTVTVKRGEMALELCKKYGLKTHGFFMIGSPEETVEDLKKTRKLLENPNVDSASVFYTTPLPGTELWDYALENNVIKKDFFESPNRMNNEKLHEDLVLTNHISKNELKEWHKLFIEISQRKPKPGIGFNVGMIKFFFYLGLYKKLWKKRKHIPVHIKKFF